MFLFIIEFKDLSEKRFVTDKVELTRKTITVHITNGGTVTYKLEYIKDFSYITE